MKTVIIIPARYASTRYPGKPLVELTLPDGARKSLIQLSWEAACRVTGVDGVYVATDDARIRDASNAFGADVIMTSETCRNGTERLRRGAGKCDPRRGFDCEFTGRCPSDTPLVCRGFDRRYETG
jgi:3-deoxy-manno-octulosonate cytidylyltransferase (CMP-KDO synthetase)